MNIESYIHPTEKFISWVEKQEWCDLLVARGVDYKSYIGEYLYNFLSHLFSWVDQPEGAVFWHDIAQQCVAFGERQEQELHDWFEKESERTKRSFVFSYEGDKLHLITRRGIATGEIREVLREYFNYPIKLFYSESSRFFRKTNVFSFVVRSPEQMKFIRKGICMAINYLEKFDNEEYIVKKKRRKDLWLKNQPWFIEAALRHANDHTTFHILCRGDNLSGLCAGNPYITDGQWEELSKM